MKRLIFALSVLLLSTDAFAGKPTCHGSSGGYCRYTGYVERIYINSGNLILFYFDEAMDDGEWDKAGLSANQRSAATVLLNENPDFAKLFYSTALSAQASNRQVTVQMSGVHAGYLKIDRIWLAR
ncbi:hypothetical protein FLL45_08095 [Aliikangiella marina]|uniref:Uncharacterized protein n=1 Tax=Aliikangiella marina TaxID=1712262 RepID=A0A545TCG9_9GAMM|nr:hypothetical protein [Aliikangiella marina]TQV74912.1 hypothetical protein FLL45_08095 [Aliikangiella marina]